MKFEILETWNGETEVGFNTIEFFNVEGDKIKPKMINILSKFVLIK